VDDEAESLPAVVLGRYRLGPRIASGSLGTVVAATDIRSGRAVAVKFFDGASDNFAAWISEMRLALRLHHAHIVQCLDVGHDAQHDLCVLVFARAMGGSLRRALASGRRLTDPQIHRMLVELAAALAHAHAGRVVHCDVKPENILALERLGEPPWALTDFGTGVFLVDGAVLPGPVGSPPYMSPEALLGGTNAASDQYSLGVVAHELHSGERVRLAGRSAFRLRHHRRSGLLAIVARLLDPDPEARFASCECLRLVLTASRAAFDVTRAAGAAYLLANDAVSSVRPDGQRTLLGRVPRACRFVQDGGEPAVIVAGDRRVASFEGAATTMLAGDHGFDTFVASRRHAAIWLLQDRGIACADLSGRVRGGGGPPPDEWAEGLADGAPPLGAVVATDRAILGLHGRTTLMLATRRDHDVTARPLQVPAPLYALHHAGGELLALCGDERAALLLRLEPGGFVLRARWDRPVDCVRVDPTDGRAALLVHRDQP
jgi:hypothetical protein